ncbi:MAG: hypothetical protein ACRDOB_06150 [Streptosporangiaceae bacterium]
MTITPSIVTGSPRRDTAGARCRPADPGGHRRGRIPLGPARHRRAGRPHILARVPPRAEELMADAVGAEQAFFSTCGSSLSVKAAMLAVADGQGDLLLSRDSHKSVVAGPDLQRRAAAVDPPRYDARLHLAHPPSPHSWRRPGNGIPMRPAH